MGIKGIFFTVTIIVHGIWLRTRLIGNRQVFSYNNIFAKINFLVFFFGGFEVMELLHRWKKATEWSTFLKTGPPKDFTTNCRTIETIFKIFPLSSEIARNLNEIFSVWEFTSYDFFIFLFLCSYLGSIRHSAGSNPNFAPIPFIEFFDVLGF